MNNYQRALEQAGAKVLAFSTFGDYQGRWIAKVDYRDKIKWICGSYGSCSGCDAFEAEFYHYPFDDEGERTYDARLGEFGQSYLERPSDYGELLAEAERDSEWDMDSEDIVHFLKANA